MLRGVIKDLNIKNIPSDLFTGMYIVEILKNGEWIGSHAYKSGAYNIVIELLMEDNQMRYKIK